MDRVQRLTQTLTLGQSAVVAFFMGGGSTLALAPFHVWPVLFLTFSVLLWTFDSAYLKCDGYDPVANLRKKVLSFFLMGWAFGFGYFLFGIYWVGYSFLANENSSKIAMPFAVLALTSGLGLFYGVAASATALLWRNGYARIAGFVLTFFIAEMARSFVLTGFPWNLFGQALAANNAMMQTASYIGIYGLTLIALLVFTTPVALLSAPGRRNFTPFILALLALLFMFTWGSFRLANGEVEFQDANIRIVQPNIPQQEKWKPENRAWIFHRLLDLSRSGGQENSDINRFAYVIWPESTVPFLFVFNNEIYNQEARDLLAALIPEGTKLLVGADRAEGLRSTSNKLFVHRVFNSLFILGFGSEILGSYDKNHLVPFGEYIPFSGILERYGFRALSHQLRGYNSGEHENKNATIRSELAFIPLICYEIIFPQELNYRNERPKWIVNITNDAWFGASSGPYQHLHQARVRAVEQGLPVIRAANTGISGVIDPYGRLVAELGLGITGVVDHKLPTALSSTFYTKNQSATITTLFLFPVVLYLIIVYFTSRAVPEL